jgi:hypothetical protein
MPFSEVVSSPGWRDEAESWVRERVAEGGGQLVGDITQPRVRPWSTQLVVPTDLGRLWFKANCPALRFEPTVHAVLARLDPCQVDPPFALDAERGWVVTLDRGPTLGDSHEATLDDWQAVVRVAGALQRQVAEGREELLATGLPDCAPHTVPDRYAGLIEALAALPPPHPSHLEQGAVRRLRDGAALVEEAARTLEAGPMPPASFQHGDLHPGNAFAVEGGLRVFDFGDAQWAHPLESLAVPWGWLHRHPALPWPSVVEAYASVWADVVEPAELDRLFAAAVVTQAVNRALTWWGAIADAADAELVDWGDRPRFFLELALEPLT